MKKTKVLLFLIIIFAFLLRFFYLDKIPIGFYSDEASYGYNAYSILKTARDEYGNFLPLAFKSFGDYKTPLYIYFMVPFVAVFGLTEFAVRSTSLFLSIILVILSFLLVKKLSKNNSLALLTSFVVSCLPFSLQFNRMAHENNLVVVLVLSGIIFLINFLKEKKHLYLSSTFFALSLYTYHDARVFIPIFLFMVFFLYKNIFLKNIRKSFFATVLFLMLIIPLLFQLTNKSFLSRARYTNVFSDKGVIASINEKRGEDNLKKFPNSAIFHNKIVSFSKKFISNYTSHFSFDFLFLKGEDVKIYHTIENGLVYLTFAPFLIFGFIKILTKKIYGRLLILTWFILSFVPASLTRFVPSSSRSFIVLPVLSFIIALGLMSIIEYINSSLVKRVLILFIILVFSFNMVHYLHYYYVHTPRKYAREWHYGVKEVVEQVKIRQWQYDTIWFSKNVWGYIYPLFYLKYPPEKYQSQAFLGELNEYGFGWVSGFDKYVFAAVPDDIEKHDNTLFITTPWENPNLNKPLVEVYYPDRSKAFIIFDSNSLRN